MARSRIEDKDKDKGRSRGRGGGRAEGRHGYGGPGFGRVVAGALGVVLMGVGAVLVLGTGDVVQVGLWVGGAILAHDVLIAPLVLGVGLLVAGLRPRVYGTVRGALLVAGCLTLVALPVLLRPGTPANSSVLPLPYLRGWLTALLAVTVVTGVLLTVPRVVRALWGRRRPG
ncbi:hypothetical protein ACIQM4_18750 [Streptomyces sp. NPDC091272]|uniref:hypothetical protein n=1 Tax=Streptomyces sp. NPDC091272 TaxID=3365981 RepID=UPI003828F67A